MENEEQKQNLFKEIPESSQCETIFKRAADLNSNLQIKIGDEPLIILKAIGFQNGSLLAEYIAGLDPKSSEVDVVFEAEKQWYSGVGTLTAQPTATIPQYSVAISKLFEIQRREVFRVRLQSDLIKASFKIANTNKSFSVTDLSEKGFALLISKEETSELTTDTELTGHLTVEGHDSITLSIKVVRVIETKEGTKAGCEIVNANQATHQKVAVLVNECHRLLFAKMK